MKTRVKRAIIPADQEQKVKLEVTAEMIDDVFGYNKSKKKQHITTTISKLNEKATFKKKKKWKLCESVLNK